jgi:tRNA (guanine-N7-)-methyltransferase
MYHAIMGRDRGDTDYGVPFPGRLVERSLFTRTRVDLPPPGVPFDWAAVFGRAAPRVLDLGCGNGRFLIGSALARPGHDHLGIDLVPPAIHHARRRAGERGLRNVRFALGDAAPFLFEHAAKESLDEIHILHPQPFFGEKKRELRMITPELVAAAWRARRPGGIFVLQTDNPRYWRYIEETVPVLFEWRREDPGEEPRTRREILARKKGLAIWRGVGVPRKGLSAEEVDAIARRLPRPLFDANRPRFRARGR